MPFKSEKQKKYFFAKLNSLPKGSPEYNKWKKVVDKFVAHSVDVSKQFLDEDFKSQEQNYIKQGIRPQIVKSYIERFKTIRDKNYRQLNDQIHGLENVKDRKNIDSYKTFKELETIVDYVSGQVDLEGTSLGSDIEIDAKPIYEDNIFEIYYADSPRACIKYKGNIPYGWCVSRNDSSNMYYTYRFKEYEPAFYFVKIKDRTKKELGFFSMVGNVFNGQFKDKYHFFVLQTLKGAKIGDTTTKQYVVTSAMNDGDKQMSWNDIVAIEPRIANLQEIFKPVPLAPKEKEFYYKYKNGTDDTTFCKLDYTNKRRYLDVYVRQEQLLSDVQFKCLPEDLKNLYVGFGVGLSENQLELIKTNKNLLKRYRQITEKKYEEYLKGTRGIKFNYTELLVLPEDKRKEFIIKLGSSDDISSLFKYSPKENHDKIINILFNIGGKEFIMNLSSEGIDGLLAYSLKEYQDKIITMLFNIGGKDFVMKSDRNVIFDLIRNALTKYHDKIINSLINIGGEEFIMNLDSIGIYNLVTYSSEPDKIINELLDKGGEEFIMKLNSNGIDYLVTYLSEPDKIINKLLDKGGEEFIMNLDSIGIYYLVTYLSEPDKIINKLLDKGGKDFVMKLNNDIIDDLLRKSREPEKIINKLFNIGGKEFIMNLDSSDISYLLNYSSEPQKIKHIKQILQKYGKLPKEAMNENLMKTPLDEIFKSLTSLQEELNEQNKLNIKEKNLEKVKQFLLEKEMLNEISIDAAYEQHYKEKGIPRNIFDQIVAADPFNKPDFLSPYSRWILKRYKEGHIKLEDLPAFTEYLTTYNRYKDNYKNVDWNKLFTKADLYNVVKDDIAYSQAKTGNVNLCEPIEGSEKFYENENWCIIVPKTEYAACYYGRSTEWCTAWGEKSFDERHKGKTNRFKGYNNREPLYIIINKNNQNEKYQFHFVDMDRESNYNESYEFRDKNDNLITQNSNLFKKLIKIFYDNNTFLSDEASNKVKVMYKLAVNNLKRSDITDFILNSENKKESINLLDSKYDNLGTDFLNDLTWKDLNHFNVFERINGVISHSKKNAVYDFLVKNNNVINNLDEVGLDFMLNNTSNRMETVNILLNNYNIVNNIRNIRSILIRVKNPKEVINFLNKKYNGLGTDFINSLSSNSPGLTSEDKIKYLIRDSPNPEEIKEILQQYGILPKNDSNSPINEIFKSLTSLQEELNEQNKVNVKQRNLEKVKQFLLERELLSEKDNRQFIVNKLGMTQEVADFAHKISDKYSIWIANVIKNNFPSGYNIIENELKNVIEMFKDENKPVLDIKNLNWDDALNYYNLYTYIKDWRDSPDVPSVNLKNMSWEEAERLSREWHSSLGGGGKVSDILDEKDKIIHKFSNGFYWVLREDSRCEKSRQSMGHCATASKSDMYLFRLIKNDEEFITADWHPTDRYIMQLKGKANTKPKEIYYPYIMWLVADSGYIDELRTNKGYSTETNFHLSDLNQQQLKHVISKNPNIINLLDILSMSEDKIKNIVNLLGDDLNKVVIKLATEKFDDLSNILIIKDNAYSKNLISLLFKFFGKSFINNLNSKNLNSLIYRLVDLEDVKFDDEDKVKDKIKSKIIDYILEIGGEELYYRLTTKEFLNNTTMGFMYIKSKTKGVNKFILNLLKKNGKEMLMNFNENEIQYLFSYMKETSIIKFIRLFIKIGGEDFLNKIAKNESFFNSLYVYIYKIQNKDKIINDMITIGGKNFLMNLNEENIKIILWLTSNRDELINKIINIGGEDFIKSLSVNTVYDFISGSSYENKNQIKSLFQQYGKLPKEEPRTPMNEIFNSLTSLQEELNEQNKVNLKQKNLEKVKQFLLEKKNLLNEISIQDAYNQYYKEKVSQEDFNEIVKADPFSKPNFLSKYSRWMIGRYIQKHIKLEDLPAFTEYIKTYERYKDKYKNVDWNQLFTKDDLFNVVKDDLAYSQAKTGTVNLCEPIDGSEKIYEDSKWCIITPKTEYTACYYGRNTEWCTAWGEMSFDERHKGKTSRFESHHRQGPLYIIINRNNQDEKYQFHFESNQFMDVKDRVVNKNSETFKELIDIFSKDEILDKLKGETRVKLLISSGRILEKLTKENIIYLNEYDIKHILSITPKENHENIIMNLLSVGGKKIAMSLVNFPDIISYISEENRLKFIINLLTVGGKNFLMKFYFFSDLLNYFRDTKITTDIINLMIKIGGKEFLVDKLPFSEELLNMIIYYKGLNFIDKLLSIGGKEFVMNLSKNDKNIDRIMKAGGRSISGNEPSKIIIAKKLLSVGGKDFIMKLSRYYKPLNIILDYIGKGKVDSLINYIIKIGGKDFLINSDSHVIYRLLNYSSNPGKLFISLLLIGGEEFVMNFNFFHYNSFTTLEKENVFKYFENSKVSTDVINIILKIGGKDFVMNLKEREVLIILLNSGFGSDARDKMIKKLISIGGKELILKFKNVNLIVPSGDYQLLKKTIQIGGKEYVEKLDYNVMTDIIINTPKEKINELFVMMLNLGGKEFVKNLDEELLKDIFRTEFLKDETKTKIRNIIKQNNIKIKIDEQINLERKELLSEKDNRENIVKKLGLPQEVADFAHNISDKYSLWIAKTLNDIPRANSFIKAYQSGSINSDNLKFRLSGYREGYEQIIRMFKDDNRPPLDIKNLSYGDGLNFNNVYNYIKDWRDNPNVPTLNLRNMSWQEAERLSREWHESLEASGKVSYILDDKDEIIHEFNDGFYWVLRKDSYCEKSEKSMGHCATATNSNMYLFRLIKDDEEFITIDWHPNEKYVIQIKGKKNSKPKEEYYPYIIWLIADSGYIGELRTDIGYKPESNFHLEDLKSEELIYVIFKNPKIKGIGKLLANSSEPDKIINELLDKGGNDFIMKLGEDNILNLLEFSSEPEQILNILGEKGKNFIIKSRMDVIRLLLNESKEPKKILNALLNIGGKEFIMNLDTNMINWLLQKSDKLSETEKFINILLTIGGKEFIKYLTDENITYMVKISKGIENLFYMLGDKGKQFIINMISNPSLINFLLVVSKDRDAFINMLFNIGGEEFIMNLNSQVINSLLKYSSEPEKIINLLGKKGKEYINGLKKQLSTYSGYEYFIDTYVVNVIGLSKSPTKLINLLGEEVGNKIMDMLPNVGNEKFFHIIQLSPVPKEIFNLLGAKGKKFFQELDNNNKNRLIHDSKNPNEVREILQKLNTPLNEIFNSLTSLQEELNEQNKVNIKKKNLEKVKQFLLEKDNRDFIVKKMGLPQEIADWAHEISDKYSLWIANQIKKELDRLNLGRPLTPYEIYALTGWGTTYRNIISMFKDDNRPPLNIKNLNLDDAEDFYNIYTYIKDWRDNPNTPTLNLRNMSWDEAERLSREWHESLKAAGRVSYILDDKDEIIHEFNDGFYWVLRKDNRCVKSAESMGHCATASRGDMYLFRLIKNDEEFITADWQPNEKYVIQIKGKKNSKPKEEYYPYIIWLIAESGYINELKTNTGYKPETNFHLLDLNSEQLIYVLNKNKNIINLSYLLYNSSEPDKIINELINVGGKDFVIKLNDSNANALLTYSSEPEKIIKFGGKDFLMKIAKDSIKYIIGDFTSKAYKEYDEDKDEKILNDLYDYIYDFKNTLINIGGKDFIMKFKPQFIINYFISHNSGIITDNDINRLLSIGGKDFVMKLDYDQITYGLIKKTSKENRDNIINKLLTIGGKDFIENWSLNNFDINYNFSLAYSSEKNRENVKNLIQKYTGGEPTTPMNEIFNSLSSLQEELTEQRKITIKESNLMKVQNFIKMKKNNH